MNTNSATRGAKVPLPAGKKYSNDGPYAQENVPKGYNTGGYNSGSNSGNRGGYVSGSDRKPIKYDSKYGPFSFLRELAHCEFLRL